MLKLMLSVLLFFFAIETWANPEANERSYYINDARGVDPEACMQITAGYKPVKIEAKGVNYHILHIEIGKDANGQAILKCQRRLEAEKRNRINPKPHDLDALRREDCQCEGKVIVTLIK